MLLGDPSQRKESIPSDQCREATARRAHRHFAIVGVLGPGQRLEMAEAGRGWPERRLRTCRESWESGGAEACEAVLLPVERMDVRERCSRRAPKSASVGG